MIHLLPNVKCGFQRKFPITFEFLTFETYLKINRTIKWRSNSLFHEYEVLKHKNIHWIEQATSIALVAQVLTNGLLFFL